LDSLNLPEMQVASQDRIREFGMARDTLSRSPYYQFEDSTGWYQGWYEDSVSLDDKYGFVAREGLAGIAIFPIGYDDGVMDMLLAERFGTRVQADSTAR
jgi:spore germination protein YaaH